MSKDQVDFGDKRSRKPEYVQWQLLILSNTVKYSQVQSGTDQAQSGTDQAQPRTVKYCQVQLSTVKYS